MSKLIQQFEADDIINDVCFGTLSPGIISMATNASDVQIYRVGRNDPLVTLLSNNPNTGYKSIKFGLNDNMITGSLTGIINVWDCSRQKLIRSLTGHGNEINKITFHPHGDYISSGGNDTKIKIFDLRQRECIKTYRARSPITALEHSGDGRWLVSGHKNGDIILWDLTLKKISKINYLIDSSQLPIKKPIDTILFHPTEFMLCTSGGDKTIKFWDFDTFEFIDESTKQTKPIYALHFNHNGNSIYQASYDSLKEWQWEPFTCVNKYSISHEYETWKYIKKLHLYMLIIMIHMY